MEMNLDREVSGEEVIAAFQGPAVASNRSLITTSQQGVRISFVEQDPTGRSYYRTAVLLSYPDAIALKVLLTDVLKDAEAAIQRAEDGHG